MFNTTHGQEPNAIPVCYPSDELPTNRTYVHVSERKRRYLENPDLPLSQQQIVISRIVTPLFNDAELWVASLRDWLNCCFSEEQLIILATEAIRIAEAKGKLEYMQNAEHHFHGARSKAQGFIPEPVPETFTEIAQALQKKIGKPLPLGELIIYTTNGIQWQTGSSLSHSHYYAITLFSILPDRIETDSEQQIIGYWWGSGIITANDSVETWEEFARSFFL
ncbi:MAG: hypothetical protein IT211_05915 [Armatimonadetes bacterium]|nr:hypothetical protein [Armatimonadota bacterium]